MTKTRKFISAQATDTSELCNRCESEPTSVDKLCVSCIKFLSRIFDSKGADIDQGLATVLKQSRATRRVFAVQKLGRSTDKSFQAL